MRKSEQSNKVYFFFCLFFQSVTREVTSPLPLHTAAGIYSDRSKATTKEEKQIVNVVILRKYTNTAENELRKQRKLNVAIVESS